MSQEAIERRLQRLEDMEALRALKFAYFAAADDNYDGDTVASLFEEDGIWDGGDLGVLAGRAAIAASFKANKGAFRSVHHYGTNPQITLSDDQAHCVWTLLLVKTTLSGTTMFAAGRYSDICVKSNARWLFRRLELRLESLKALCSGS